jgi:hypothetical protein
MNNKTIIIKKRAPGALNSWKMQGRIPPTAHKI